MQNKRLLELDGLRGISALGVVLFHYFYHYNTIYGHQKLSVGWSFVGQFGVQLFFLISGFVIYMTINRVEQPLDFVISRFSRLYPVYWVSALITFLIVLYFGLHGREVSFLAAALNILMFQSYLGIPDIDGSYWTLAVELSFYFLVFGLYLSNSLHKIDFFFIPLIIISVAHSAELVTIPSLIYEILILKHLPFFMSGICFYRIYYNQRSKIFNFGILLICLFSTIIIHSFSRFIIFSFIYLFFFLVISGYMGFLKNNCFVFIGGISYSLYLLHQNIGYVIINEFYKRQLNPLLGIFFALIFIIMLSVMITKYVEKPSIALIRQNYGRTKKGISKQKEFIKESGKNR